MNLVILCGGKGSRLGSLTKKVPKPLLKIYKKPFIEYIINFYQKYNFNKIYLIGYYKSNSFKKLYNNKFFNYIQCEFIKEKKPLDTGGALNVIKNKFKGDFVLVNGDSYLNYNFSKFYKFHKYNNKHTMILTKNTNYKSNTKLSNLDISGRLVSYKKKSNYMNAGIYFFKQKIFNSIKKNQKISLENQILPELISKNQIKGIKFDNFFIDIGVKKNLETAKKKLKNIIEIPAIFLDRDGVLNKDTGYPHKFRNLKWIQSTITFLKNLKNFRIRIFIVTNQSGIARGIYDEKDFFTLQSKMKQYLGKKNIFFDEVKYCPHHPKHGQKKYLKNCKCRKPGNKMILDLIKYWKINPKKSIMIGDKVSDFYAAKKSNIKFYYYNKKNLKLIKKLYEK